MNDRLLVLKMIAYIEKNLRGQVNAETMAVKPGYSANRLRQKFYTVQGKYRRFSAKKNMRQIPVNPI